MRGATGHKIVFDANVEFSNLTLVSRDALDFIESDDTTHRARWYPMPEIRSGRRRVMPTALEPAMQSGASETGSANIARRG